MWIVCAVLIAMLAALDLRANAIADLRWRPRLRPVMAVPRPATAVPLYSAEPQFWEFVDAPPPRAAKRPA